MTHQPEITVRQRFPIPISNPTDAGIIEAEFVSFDGFDPPREHFAVIFPHTDLASPLVRIHSECVTGDVFGSQRCDCGAQLHEAVQRCAGEGGIILYLRQEGRGIGFNAKLDAYRLQAAGLNTFEANVRTGHPADARDYAAAVGMLMVLGVTQCRLLTNNPAKANAIRQSDINLIEILPTEVHLTARNATYLRDKATHAGHIIKVPERE